MSKINYLIEQNVAFIELNNPPLNTFGYEQRRDLVSTIESAVSDQTVKAIILLGSDKAFSGGADITEFETPLSTYEPNLHTVMELIEKCPKPFIAAISGFCLGGGLEVSLACHFRVATADATVGLPEVKIGIIPGAGGTQRLPRLAGVEIALNMIVSGNPVPAAKLKGTKLFDEIISGDLKTEALAFAKKILAEQRPIKLARDIKINDGYAEGFIQYARNTMTVVSKNYPAPIKVLDAIHAAVFKPFNQGIEIERNIILSLINSPESRALRHVFFAERIAHKIEDVPGDTPVRNIQKVAVIGAGTMGGGITMNFLQALIPVTLIESEQAALDKGLATIKQNYANSVKKGKLSEENVTQMLGLLKPTLNFDELKDADLIIEAVFEKMEIKQEVFKKLDQHAKKGAILATNTSTLNLDVLASVTNRVQDVVGMHFFAPANLMKLLEVVRGAQTSKEVLATVMMLAKKIKKIAVVSGVCDGFIGNRMIAQYASSAQQLLYEGASPYQIDSALESFGMAMGPYRMGDLSGNDIGWLIRKRKYKENPELPSDIIGDRLCELGRFGQKVGSGWYRYESGSRKPIQDSEVEKLIADCRTELGLTPRKISDHEIVERCIFALVNEGAKILEEKIAARASDIDIVYLYGYGFPAFRGGPMHYADQVGLYHVVRRLKTFARQDPKWSPAEMLVKLADAHKTFSKDQ